jgi:hypothetical protein
VETIVLGTVCLLIHRCALLIFNPAGLSGFCTDRHDGSGLKCSPSHVGYTVLLSASPSLIHLSIHAHSLFNIYRHIGYRKCILFFQSLLGTYTELHSDSTNGNNATDPLAGAHYLS